VTLSYKGKIENLFEFLTNSLHKSNIVTHITKKKKISKEHKLILFFQQLYLEKHLYPD